jgi:hypothetical protein
VRATVDTRGKKHVRKPRGQSNGAIFLSRQKRQSVAPRRSADASFYDCVLKTTIDRRVELRRSVGD